MEPAGNARKPWKIVCFSNRDNADDPIKRRSVSGSVMYVVDVPVSWQSKREA